MNQNLRWKKRLALEMNYTNEFKNLTFDNLEKLLRKRKITSINYDTVISLDWPHYCSHSTLGCGGQNGWRYTFQGNQANAAHNRHAAMVDQLAKKHPALFVHKVKNEVKKAVESGSIPYANLRLAGSGETIEAYLTPLKELVEQGINLWGFTRNLHLAKKLHDIGVSIIISCDKTSPNGFIEKTIKSKFPIAYTSIDVNDQPPPGTLVTFPIHRVGKVREVVDSKTICPKVLSDFLDDSRPPSFCQNNCHKCHLKK